MALASVPFPVLLVASPALSLSSTFDPFIMLPVKTKNDWAATSSSEDTTNSNASSNANSDKEARVSNLAELDESIDRLKSAKRKLRDEIALKQALRLSVRSRSSPPTARTVPAQDTTVHEPSAGLNPRSRSLPPSLPVKDILSSLDKFYGNKDQSADCQCGSVPSVFELVRRHRLAPDSGGIPEAQHVTIASQKLAGPALLAYMHRCAIERWAPALTMAELRVRLSSLFVDAEVDYTDKLIHMTFSFSTLSTDIEMFRKYVRRSSFASSKDHNNFLYSLLRKKMNAASHNILLTAAAEHQLQLLESASFDRSLTWPSKSPNVCSSPVRSLRSGLLPTPMATALGPPSPRRARATAARRVSLPSPVKTIGPALLNTLRS